MCICLSVFEIASIDGSLDNMHGPYNCEVSSSSTLEFREKFLQNSLTKVTVWCSFSSTMTSTCLCYMKEMETQRKSDSPSGSRWTEKHTKDELVHLVFAATYKNRNKYERWGFVKETPDQLIYGEKLLYLYLNLCDMIMSVESLMFSYWTELTYMILRCTKLKSHTELK